MAKRKEDLENPMVVTPIFTHPSFRRNACKCGCGEVIDPGMDSYVEIDDMIFSSDYCVTNYFIKEAGGRRVYGGAC